jgi:hypothetical protein
MQSGQHGAGGARPAGRAVGYVGSSAGAPPPTPGTCSVVSTVWRSSPRSEEELSELPECVLCERLVRRAERGVRSGARVPSLARVAGHAQRRARYGASRGDRVRGDEGEESADGNVAPFLHRMQGIRRNVSSRSGRRGPTLRGQSLALGEQSGDERGGPAGGRARVAPARRGVGAPRDGVGVPTTQHPPAHPCACVGLVRGRPWDVCHVGSGVGAVPRAARSGRRGMWVAARERRRPPLGPVLLCQPCGGHPLVVRKSSVSYPSVCCVNAWYGARSAA